MTSGGGDILSYLGVVAPTAENSATKCTVINYNEASVAPSKQEISRKSDSYSGCLLNRCSSPERIRKRLSNGAVMEFEIYDSIVPCNACYNVQVAKEKKQLSKPQFEDSKAIQPNPQSKEALQKAVQKLQQHRSELTEFYAEHQKSLEEKKQLEKLRKQQERKTMELKAQSEGQMESVLLGKKSQVSSQWSKIRKEEIELNEIKKMQLMQEDKKGGVNCPSHQSPNVALGQMQSYRENLLSYWKEQIQEKQKKLQDQRNCVAEIEKAVNAQIRDEASEKDRRYQEIRKEFLGARPWADFQTGKEDRNKAQQQQKVAERQQVSQVVNRLNEQMELVKRAQAERKQRQMEDLRNQVDYQRQLRLEQKMLERDHDQYLLDFEAGKVEKRILLKCPVSHSVLPAKAFNITSSHKSNP